MNRINVLELNPSIKICGFKALKSKPDGFKTQE